MTGLTSALAGLRLALLGGLTLLLGAFHGFVGWHKLFSSREELMLHKAWTVHIPDVVGRAVGMAEIVLTAALLVALVRPSLARLGLWSCGAFIALEIVSTITHQVSRDGAPLAQNLLSIALTGALAWLFATRNRRQIRSA